MNFRLPHHNKIAVILQSLDSRLLAKSFAYFGGGTLITLEFDEYRWSKDIDFICPISSSGYKLLRREIFDHGYEVLFTDLTKVELGRCTTDQYGIRMLVNVAGEAIKAEIIAESRFKLDFPRYFPWSSVPCLSFNDCFTSKLLANSDRYMDDSVDARDLIDLAVLRLEAVISESAIEKAENAYEVIRPLKEAIDRFQYRTQFRDQCFDRLQINQDRLPGIIDGIDLLAQDFGMSSTSRSFREKHDPFDFEF
ncbi:MAG: nucleotidyl transferase AbiEii/AbiGii toxin family protein [Cyanobacteria bacterium P01_C01_bin.72]